MRRYQFHEREKSASEIKQGHFFSEQQQMRERRKEKQVLVPSRLSRLGHFLLTTGARYDMTAAINLPITPCYPLLTSLPCSSAGAGETREAFKVEWV